MEVKVMTDDGQLNVELVRRITEASYINLNKDELKKFVKQFKIILETFKELDQVNTDDVKPCFHPIEFENILREDLAEKWEWKPLSNSKHKEKSYIKGPRIL
jgi:aspartyl-tRNA(Asn)/glutamyl-tRNA(Gln) amidotransferase subunit C